MLTQSSSLVAIVIRVQAAGLSRATVIKAIVGVVLGGALLVGLALPALSRLGEPAPASRSPAPSSSPVASMALPDTDVPGDDIVGLPRYPDSIRSDHEVALDGGFRLIVTEYLADAPIDEVRAFYQGVIATQGWERADIGFANGEWSYALVDGDKLALIEIERAASLVEIDLQVSEPAAVASPSPSPVQSIAPPAAPPPPPPGEDDDDSDDGGGGDDDGGDD